jgi:hypothetical protein
LVAKTMRNILTLIGLFLNFIGIIFLLYFSIKTKGAITHADITHLGLKWIQWLGCILLGMGFLVQITANSLI